MPNKDSFTFSDKLKKSKSLPLSKRIPSKVGGDGKAKRTLIQRAQRDLPFIIVAAAALLLLPILSRNSGTDDLGVETPMDFVAPDTSGSDAGGLGQEIVPSGGFKNPLDYIVSRSGKDTEGVRDTFDSGDEESGYEATTPPYTSSENGERATEVYAPAAKGAVRNALVRKATQISALRNSKTMAAGASSGVSRSLATGSAASSGGGAAGPRVGTRPVALQPMASAGKGGRSETGEGLYAEAARSLGAMNRGGSKQALFDAQLKNVDGTPLGSIGGGPNFGSGAGKLGAGGAPSNNVGYKPYLPWWWDFEKQKAMKHWELWNYNFQKAASDSIIKVGTGVALCLLSGNADGKVDKFFGDKGGAVDFACVDIDTGEEYAAAGDLGEYTSSTEGTGDSQKKSNNSYDALKSFCDDKKTQGKNVEVRKTETGKKGPLDVRMRCLGWKYKDTLKSFKRDYSDKYGCEGVNESPKKFELVIKNGLDKTKTRQVAVYALALPEKIENGVKKPDTSKEERLVYLEEGKALNAKLLDEKIASMQKITGETWYATKVGAISIDDDHIRVWKLGREWGITRGRFNKLKQKLQDSYVTKKDLATGEETSTAVTKDDINKHPERKHQFYDLDVLQECSVANAFLSTKIEGVSLAKGDVANFTNVSFQQTEKDGEVSKTVTVIKPPFMQCDGLNKQVRALTPDLNYTFRAKISNPGSKVYAILLEEVQYADKGSDVKDRQDGKWTVKEVMDLNQAENKRYQTPESDGIVYSIPSAIGLSITSKGTQQAYAAPGTGRVYWITTMGGTPKVKGGDSPKEVGTHIALSDLVDIQGGAVASYCEYKWGCGGQICSSGDKKSDDTYCAKLDEASGKYELYQATAKIAGDKLIRVSSAPVDSATALDFLKQKAAVATNKYLAGWVQGNESSCHNCGAEAYANDGGACQDICYEKLTKKIFESKGKDSTGKEVGGTIDELQKRYPDVKEGSPLCPECNEKKQEPMTPEERKKCTATISGTFDRADYKLTPKLKTEIATEAARFYNECVKNLRAEKETLIYVQGFTSYSGEVSDAKVKNFCNIGDTECLAQQQEIGARNTLLSEDRAVSVVSEFISLLKQKIKNDSELSKRVLLTAEFFPSNAERDNPTYKFDIGPRKSSSIDSIITAALAGQGSSSVRTYGDDPSSVANGEVQKLSFKIYGYGALGASVTETPSERFVRLSIDRDFYRLNK